MEDELTRSLGALNSEQLAAALRFFLSGLEQEVGVEISDGEVRKCFGELTMEGRAEALRLGILAGESDPDDVSRWSRAVLSLAANDPHFRKLVSDSISDARQTHMKDLGLSTLIVIGAVAVALKYRPKSLEKTRGKLKIQWKDTKAGKDTDVGIIAAIIKAITGH